MAGLLTAFVEFSRSAVTGALNNSSLYHLPKKFKQKLTGVPVSERMRQASHSRLRVKTQPESIAVHNRSLLKGGGVVIKHTPIHVVRDSITGRFVPPSTAVRRPATTERETVYRPSPKRG
jgi:hypothetical protein